MTRELIKAVTFKAKEGRIYLFDKDGNYVEGKNASWGGNFYCESNHE